MSSQEHSRTAPAQGDPLQTSAGGDHHGIIVLGGHPPDRRVLDVVPVAHGIVCADSGLDHALRLGLTPTAVIGDMDSVDAHSLEVARSLDCDIVSYPTHKDATDAELALTHVLDAGYRHVTVVWGGGDRIDHVLGVFAALAHPRLGGLDSLTAWIASDRIDIVHEGHSLISEAAPGTTVSLISLGTRDTVVSTTGLQWDLERARLASDSARGLSNVMISIPVTIHAHQGVTAVVTPGCVADSVPLVRTTRVTTTDTGGML